MKLKILVHEKVSGHIAKFLMFGEQEITYWIGKEFWGRGIATTALQIFLKEKSERPLYARTAYGNFGLMRVLKKYGFVKTGIERVFDTARGEEIEEFIFDLDV
jgi:RimJ/RimL family protein N-acetyltransferase